MVVDLAKVDYGQEHWEGVVNDNFSGLSADTLHLLGGPVSRQNLILNSATPRNTKHWSAPVGGNILVIRNLLYKNGKVNLFSIIHDKEKPGINEEVYAITDEYVLTPNTNYDVFFVAFGAVGITSFDAYMICHDADGNLNNIQLTTSVIPNPAKAVLYKLSFNSGNNVQGAFRIDNNGSTDGVDHNLFFSEVFVGKSEYWAPAANDIHTEDTGLVALSMVSGVKGMYEGNTPTARCLNGIVHLTGGIIATTDLPANSLVIAMPNNLVAADGYAITSVRNEGVSFPISVQAKGLYIDAALKSGESLDLSSVIYLGKDA